MIRMKQIIIYWKQSKQSLITVEKQKYKNKHSYEMTRFWIWIVIWSSLHELVRILRLTRGSVFESPVYRVHSEHESGLGPVLLLPVWIAQKNLSRCTMQPYTHEYTTQTYIHDYLLIHIYQHTCTTQYTHSHVALHTLVYTLSHKITYTQALNYTHSTFTYT